MERDYSRQVDDIVESATRSVARTRIETLVMESRRVIPQEIIGLGACSTPSSTSERPRVLERRSDVPMPDDAHIA